MKYLVKCECGHSVEVSTGDAGTKVECQCKRLVDVPSLHRLRQSAGALGMSADLMIETMLQQGRLPEENECVGCEKPTKGVLYVNIHCERAEVRKANHGGLQVFWLLFGWIVWKREGEPTIYGRDLSYRLPVRVCENCRRGLNDRDAEKLVRRIPLYNELMGKFPKAKVSLAMM